MKHQRFIVSALCVVAAAFAVTLPASGQAPAGGKLILTGDIAVFAGGGKPENCFVRNRFKRGENVVAEGVAVAGESGVETAAGGAGVEDGLQAPAHTAVNVTRRTRFDRRRPRIVLRTAVT